MYYTYDFEAYGNFSHKQSVLYYGFLRLSEIIDQNDGGFLPDGKTPNIITEELYLELDLNNYKGIVLRDPFNRLYLAVHFHYRPLL